MRKKFLKTVILCVVGMILTACGKNVEKEIVGNWELVSDSKGYYYQMDFYDDGTLDVGTSYGFGDWNILNDNHLKIKCPTNYGHFSAIYEVIEIKDDTMILISEDQVEAVYERIDIRKNENSADETLDEKNEEQKNEETEALKEIVSMRDYSEGMAWIMYTDQDRKYWTCIDKEGRALFQYDASYVLDVTQFTNGYAQISTITGDLYTIDTNGEIMAFYLAESEEKICCHGDGYVVTEKNNSGFDAVTYEYTIYNVDGSVLEKIIAEEEIRTIIYCGKGVFGFKEFGFYFSSKDKWCDTSWGVYPVFYDDMAVIGTTYQDYDSGRVGGVDVMTLDGEIFSYMSEFLKDWSTTPSDINENVCVIHDSSSETLVTIDFTEEKESKLDEKYSKKMYENPKPDTFTLHDGRIVLGLKGDDGKRYIGVFDKELNIVYGPIAGDASTYSDGMLKVQMSDGEESVIMDVDGNIVYSLTQKGYSMSHQYSDGAILVGNEKKAETYLDLQGNKLFEEINFENVLTKVLE